MADESMANIGGQAGITLEQSTLFNLGEVQYSDDGNQIKIENVRSSGQGDPNAYASSKYVIDITQSGALNVVATTYPTQLSIGGIRVGNSASLGSLVLDYEAITELSIQGKSGGGLEGSFQTGISNADLSWTTNGHTLSFQNIGYDASIDSLTIDYGVPGNDTALVLGMTNFDFSFSTGALALGGVSLGELAGELALSGNMELFGGGRSGEGLTLNSQINILSNPANFVRFTDEGNSLLLGDFSGALNLTNLTLDVESDHLKIQYDQMDGSFNAGRILIGDSTKPVGSIEFDFLFDSSNGRQNIYRLYPGIRQPTYSSLPTQIRSYAQSFYNGFDSSSEGLSAAVEWNLANADVSYIDDGRRVIFSGIESFGSADTTFDVRDQKVGIGISNLIGSYSIDGIRVGNKAAPIQGGAELLLSLEVFQAMDFDINGYTEVTAGGVSGGGIRIDGDYYFNNANIGLSVDENQEGVWATGVNYDIHLRDITFDVESDGVQINRGEQWSTMDIANLRWGNKNTGRSLGRVVLDRFEKNSSLQIIPGGAGQVCVGATAADPASCAGAGGRWEDRGEQGMTVALKAAFADAGLTSDGSSARNRLLWENNRTLSSGEAVNGSGTQIIFDNYSTNDGLGTSDTNNYGFQANLNIDVYETKVLKKSSGVDSQGVVGNLGDELIYTDSSRDNYTYVANPTDAQKSLRPLGFAVQGNVSFKEFNVDAVQLKHPDVTTPQTVFYGVVLQNVDLTTNLTATPIQ
jgi:hypothetical protein